MQVDIFSIMYPSYKITKPIRLIEMFGGYGSQHYSLKYLNANVEHWKLIEWAVKSIQAYKDSHCEDDNTNYSKSLNKQELIDYLYNKGISSNYNEPMTYDQIKRKQEQWLRQVYNNIIATKNIVDITKTKASDLEIVDTDKYEYIMTYSFPCQDLSLAGKRAGMSDTSTRSGLLWEVERILDECKELPQILLMENVPQVIGTDNVEHFNKWQEKLESLGYKNYHQNLIATDYGIPQTRNRTFMISILGDYSYTFPKPIQLKLKLKDMLEEDVDEKYFLSDKMLNYMFGNTEKVGKYNRKEVFMRNFDKNKENAATITTCAGNRPTDNFIIDNFKNGANLKTQLCNILIEKGMVKENDVIKHSYTDQIMSGDKKYVEMNNIMPTMTTRPDCLGVVVGTYQYSKSDNFMQGKQRFQKGKEVSDTLQTTPKEGVVYNNLRIRKLTPRETFRLMGVKDEDYERIAKNQSDSSLYHLAGDSIVVNVLMAIFKELLK